MRPFTALAAVLLLATCAQAFAQTRTIGGKVTDEEGRPVAGALIEVTAQSESLVGFVVKEERRGGGQTLRATTNGNGDFVVGVPTSGVYLVTATREGAGHDRTEVAVEHSSVPSLRLRLAKAALPEVATTCGDGGASKRFNESTGSANAGHPALGRLVRWLEAVQHHAPGCRDSAVVEAGRWPSADFEMLLADLGNISAFLRWVREKPLEMSTNARSTVEALAGGPRRESQARFIRDSSRRAAIVVYNRRFTLEEIEKIFHGNDTLLRGALLHADIAIFVPGDHSRYPTADDGRSQGEQPGTVHWQIGRALIDDVSPAPGDDPGALLWYRAVSAHLLGHGDLAEAMQHLAKARQLFPNHSQFLLDSAYLHLELSSPAVQASVEELRAGGGDAGVDSRRDELQRAERFLRAALVVEPGSQDARIRLGRTLGELGRHSDAAEELRKVVDDQLDAERSYFAQLFLGREEHALGRRDEARRRYERAAALFPEAQSPQLALAHLARESGERAAAHRALRTITNPPDGPRADPWLHYYKPHLSDAEPQMQSMRAQLSGGSR